MRQQKQNDRQARVSNGVQCAPNLDLINIVKRNGTLAPFSKQRIQTAIEMAFRDVKKLAKKEALDKDLANTIERLAHLVTEKILQLAEKDVSISVEGIQDLVEVTLMKEGFLDVARGYIIYRDQHKLLREEDPRNIKIYRNNHTLPIRFNPIKITHALHRLFANYQQEGQIDNINLLTAAVVKKTLALARKNPSIHIHHIQDLIEEVLMEEGHFLLAKAYILERANKGQQFTTPSSSSEEIFTIKLPDESLEKISKSTIRAHLSKACEEYKEEVCIETLLKHTLSNFYDEMPVGEIDTACIMAAKALIEKEPAYSNVAASLLRDKGFKEALSTSIFDDDVEQKQKTYFKQYIKKGIAIKRLSPQLIEFDLEILSEALQIERDKAILYLGMQTLYDRYFIHHNHKRLETPQLFWMRVAMGLAVNEKEKNRRAIEFYDLLSQFYFISSTPTLFNSGTMHSQLSSCYLSTIQDDLHNIFKVIGDNAQLSKWAGGLGNDWTYVRATGARIQGTNGESQGIIPFIKVSNDTAVAVNQGGKRKGALCAYLEVWHLDIEDFLELRKNTGDERRRTHDINTANWVPDLFMKRVLCEGTWTLFSPDEVPDLHDLYGKAFEKAYVEYEKQALAGKLCRYKQIQAMDLWRKMLSMLFETGHPWITFKDPCNIRSPQDHVGVIHNSNLCTEITLNTSRDETAVCNLGSVNLVKHMTSSGLNEVQLQQTVRTAIRMLDNVIDINFYPIEDAKNANLRHRPIGLGLMGFQDALAIRNISYASHQAVEFADKSMEMLSYYAILASSELAKERGVYSSYEGSKWKRGLLPIDTLELLIKERGEFCEIDTSSSMDWDFVREHVKKYGMRNSNTMAIAPTATIANIIGVTSSIEPFYKHLYAKSNLSGEFTIINPYLVQALKKQGLWDEEMVDDLKYFDGSIAEIERIPEDIKKLFPTAFEIQPEWLIECGSRRQKWIDMAQSLNLYFADVSGKRLHQMYIHGWKRGIKTYYYLRSTGATHIEKSTTDINKRGLQPKWMKNSSPSARITINRAQETEAAPACALGEECESCQ